MSILDALEDRSWDMLDAVRLGDFFDDHNIPPWIFPLAIIAIIALVVFFFMTPPAAPPEPECGDGMCNAGEDCGACPGDCGACQTPSKTVNVNLQNSLGCNSLILRLYDQDGRMVRQQQGPGSQQKYSFEGVDASSVYVEVTFSQKNSLWRSDPLYLASQDSIQAPLPADFCEKTEPPNQRGSIKVKIVDEETGDLLSATVTLRYEDGQVRDSRDIDGFGTFADLEANEWYYLIVQKSGYETYNGQANMISVRPGKEELREIPLRSTVPPLGGMGKLEVCVVDDGGTGVEKSGLVSVFDGEGNKITDGNLELCPTFRGFATHEGCYIFSSIKAGLPVYAAVTKPPRGCSPSQPSELVTVAENEKKTVFLHIECSAVGEVRVIVYGVNDTVLTEDVTITLWDAENKSQIYGSGDDGVLEVEDDYTETVPVPADTKIYAKARRVPSGYLDTDSDEIKVKPGGNATIEIELETPPPPKPKLSISGVSASPSLAGPGDVVYAKAGRVDLIPVGSSQGSAVAPSQGASLACESSWGQNRNAGYTGSGWECNLTAPRNFGSYTIVMRASKEGADPDSKSLSITVVNFTGERLYVERVAADLPVMKWNISIEVNNSPVPVQDLSESELVVNSDTGGLVANLTLSKAGPGMFTSTVRVPFQGEYTYDLTVIGLFGSALYVGSDTGTFKSPLHGGAELLGSVSPRLSEPSRRVDAVATLTFNGAPLADQEVNVEVDAINYTLVWDPEKGEYSIAFLAPDKDCRYNAEFAVVLDPSVSAQDTLYVVDGDVGDYYDCPFEELDRRNPAPCSTLAEARGCMKAFKENAISHGNLMRCVESGVDTSNCQPYTAECTQPFVYRLGISRVATNGSVDRTITNTTGEIIVGVSPSDGEKTFGPPVSLYLALPARHSWKSLPTYQLLGANFGGLDIGDYRPTNDPYVGTMIFNPASGVVTLSARCPMRCEDMSGDLDGDGAATEADAPHLYRILGSIDKVGVSPYGSYGSKCVDVNGDGRLTEEDGICLATLMTGGSLSECLRCTPTGPEVCGDQLDNDCDGQTDRDNYEESKGAFYAAGIFGRDVCACLPETPCDMKRAPNEYCMKATIPPHRGNPNPALYDGTYRWYPASQGCSSTTSGWTKICDGEEQTCWCVPRDGGCDWQWG
jgi:hypothetical protein